VIIVVRVSGIFIFLPLQNWNVEVMEKWNSGKIFKTIFQPPNIPENFLFNFGIE